MIKYLNSNIKIISLVLIVLLLIFHLWSLSIYPIPWFDETFYASIAQDFQLRGHFYPWVAPFCYEFHECVTYGPVYFFIQASIYSLIGVSCFASKFSGFLFGVLMAFTYVKLYRTEASNNTRWIEYLLLLSLFFDYTVFESFHLGRMEPVTIFFLNVSVLLQLKSLRLQNPKQQYRLAIIYSLFAVLAVLTTPRTLILLIPSGLLIIYIWIKEKRSSRFIELVILGGVFITFVSIWIFYAHGTIENMINYYKIVNDSSHYWFSFSLRDSIYIYQYPTVIVSIFISIIAALILKKKFWNLLTVYCIASILLFYGLVYMLRPYCIYTIPLFYLLAAHSLNMLYQSDFASKFSKTISTGAFIGIFVLMFGGVCAKGYYIFISSSFRNPEAIDNFIQKNIPPHSKVIGDEIYYYTVLKSGSEFQYMHLGETNENREKYQREVFDYDYIMISDELLAFNPKVFKVYTANADLQLVADFQATLDPITTLINKKRRGLVSFYSYNGHLYKRIK